MSVVRHVRNTLLQGLLLIIGVVLAKINKRPLHTEFSAKAEAELAMKVPK
jgi:hypothetical protein